MPAPLDLPSEWLDALDEAQDCARVAVVGPTDAGKSSFILALAERRPERCVIDLDPGQKMIGPPGTASLGRVAPEPRLERFVFLGSTTAVSFRALAEAAAVLAGTARRGFIVNTSGYVTGPGPRMQAIALAALRPQLVVAIAAEPELEPAIAPWPSVRLRRSPLAAAKTQVNRAASRQAAFAQALEGAETIRLASPGFEPAPLGPLEGRIRPLCSLADSAGQDMEIAVLTGAEGEVYARRPKRPVAALRLGKMWAEPGADGWKLVERLAPAWEKR
jgi:polynucleotide 5'-hydroxyl-kinase GRC3/NOL9